MRKIISFFAVCLFFVQTGFSQDYWKIYRQSNGLIDSAITEISIGEDAIYLATPKGFSIIKNEQVLSFDSTNTLLPTSKVNLIANWKDTIWLATDSGISRMVNSNMVNFNSNNGLFPEVVNDMEVNSKGELIISSLDGVQRINMDGMVDTLSTKKTYSIAINGGDSIYANVNNWIVVNTLNAQTTEVYDGSTWTNLTDTSFGKVLRDPKFISLSNGRIGITSTNNGAIFIDSVFTLKQVTFPNEPIDPSQLKFFDVDTQGDIWYAFSNGNAFNLAGELYQQTQNQLNYYRAGLPSLSVNQIQARNGKVYIGSLNGFALSNDSLIPFPVVESLETQSLKASFSYNGLAMHNAIESNGNGLGLEFPNGSGKHVFKSSTIWSYGVSDLGDTILAVHGSDFGDFIEGSINDNHQLVRKNIFKINRADVNDHLKNYHTSGYQIPKSIAEWPAKGLTELGEYEEMAPFTDRNNNGCYDPENGDVPFFLGDEALYIIYNDSEQPITGTGSTNFDMEIHLMAYTFNQPGVEFLDKSVFLRYTLVNRSNQTYQMKSGLFQNPDIGKDNNDFVGCIPSSNIAYAYNGLEDDRGGSPSTNNALNYDTIIPASGLKILNENLHSFIGFSGLNTPLFRIGKPVLFEGYINTLNANWSDGTPITYGYYGYNTNSTNIVNHLFPGDPRKVSEWSEVNPVSGGINNAYFPKSYLANIPPYEFKPGDRKVIDLVIGVGLDSSNTNYLDNIEELTNVLEKAAKFQKAVDSLAADFVYSNCITALTENKSKAKTSLLTYPNPTDGLITIVSNSNLESVRIYNLQGKVVYYEPLSYRATVVEIDLSSKLAKGTYIIQALTTDGERLQQKIIYQP